MSDPESFWEKDKERKMEERRAQGRMQDLEEAVGSEARYAASAIADLAVSENVLAHIEHRLAGILRSGPKEFQTAADIYDYGEERVGVIMNPKSFFHPARGKSWIWQVGLLGLLALTIYMVGWSPYSGQIGFALQVPSNQIALGVIAMMSLVALFLILRRGRTKKPKE